MSDEKKIVITKMGETRKTESKTKHKHSPAHHTKKAQKGILKLKGVRDPTKSPPLKRGMHKHTLRLLTDKGMRKHKKTLKQKISKMDDKTVKDVVSKSGIVTNPNTPLTISRQILDNAVSAGFVSLP
jgi:hypothetical protein